MYHVVFATKHREMTINPLYKEELYRFIWSVITNHCCKLLRIGGMANHLHILLDLNPNESLIEYIKTQEAHHRVHTFESEMQSFAVCNDIPYHPNDLL